MALDRGHLTILQAAWEKPFSTRSNIARRYADHVASLACRGLVTVLRADELTRTWRITPAGLLVLWDALNHSE